MGVTGEVERFETFGSRDYRSAAVNSQQWEVVQQAKERRHGRAGVSWRGVPLLKDPWDMTLYPMLLWELRPATVIELGTFIGGSALWLADLVSAFGTGSRIVSVDCDLSRVRFEDPRIEFVKADLSLVSDGFPVPLAELPHPWLVIEDAHVNLAGVLAHLDRYMEDGDYMVVEDTVWESKYREFEQFMLCHGSRYLVDAHYVDNFGYNGTWNWNSILKCVADGRSQRGSS